uniref:Capsid protein,Putative adhesin/invasin,Capsid protein,Factor H-binding protein n=1 Tax=Neisseria meningitidis TaxID=487 RepID=UPI0014612DA5|nr:Chain A, Capsid protein,Putative adhesin/invasin,Capsid protein,Factor H-binding protein [Hepatitis B virus]6TIK_B Chain B, Capsid protein,Putative adhesin/invasin,Capsid protein,Factor H-binding protein [Hepatitis B virus]6TIK_C Chain C, Capsid protein,Putative adhesin/invasin,Capsid protein,Factor H-binding protein [Hepatitis B virus]6TIK_D Chain D, Capsid protein,Putative adhesin/invasin,Capsid protein,Factor H-binding protein [Hepatitis B virus]
MDIDPYKEFGATVELLSFLPSDFFPSVRDLLDTASALYREALESPEHCSPHHTALRQAILCWGELMTLATWVGNNLEDGGGGSGGGGSATSDDDVKKAATVAIVAAYNNGQEINGFKAGETIYDIGEDGTITQKDATAADVEADDFKGLGLKKVVTNLTKTVNENKQNVDAKVKAAESEIEKLTTKLADTDAALADTDAALDETTNALNKLGENITTFAEETKTNIVKIDEKLEAVADTVDKHAEAFNDIADSLDETNTKADEAVKTANEAKQTAEETKQNVDAKVKAAETAAGKAEAAAGTANTAADKAEAVAAKVTDIKADIATNKADIAKNSARIDSLDKNVANLRKETRQGLAEQAALSGLFQPYNVGEFGGGGSGGGGSRDLVVNYVNTNMGLKIRQLLWFHISCLTFGRETVLEYLVSFGVWIRTPPAYRPPNAPILSTLPETTVVGSGGGTHTSFDKLPEGGRATYRGTAFGSDDAGGKLTYTIDFAAKQGNGKIEHLKSPELNVDLAAADIKPDGKRHAVISGSVLYNQAEKGSYSLGIFGGKAQEVAGSAEVKTVNGIRHIGLAAKQKLGGGWSHPQFEK